MYIKDGSMEDYSDNLDDCCYIAEDLVRNNLEIDDWAKLESWGFVSKKYNNIFMWGWLGNKVETSGWDSKKLKNKIIHALKNISVESVVDHYCGWHMCEICQSQQQTFEGSIKIRHHDKVYCCPHGVEHYIECHDYKPPDEVILAILEGEIITPYIMTSDLVRECRSQIIKEMKEEEKKIEIEKEADKRRKECQERIQKLFSPHQKELISKALSGSGNFVPLND